MLLFKATFRKREQSRYSVDSQCARRQTVRTKEKKTFWKNQELTLFWSSTITMNPHKFSSNTPDMKTYLNPSMRRSCLCICILKGHHVYCLPFETFPVEPENASAGAPAPHTPEPCCLSLGTSALSLKTTTRV